MRAFNFNPGPAMLPTIVMERAQKEFVDYQNTGCGIFEHSHRGKQFEAVLERAISNIKEIMGVPAGYSVLFIQGGASMQFAMIPMNFLPSTGFAQFVDTGTWSSKAIKEAKLFGKAEVLASSKDVNYVRIPAIDSWKGKMSKDAAYFHITSNNTIFGTQFHKFPEPVAPMFCDMSSDIMSRKIDVSKFSLIYAGAQKNLGPSGMAVVIIKDELLSRTPANCPTMLRYDTYAKENSLYNTPPTFGIYMLALVTDWVKENGGIEAMEKVNDKKAATLYGAIDSSNGYYRNPCDVADRSKMNIVYRLPNEELEAKFVKEATAAGMIGLKGHRSVGGIRASVYNAMPLEGVQKLVEFMDKFQKANPA